MVAATPQSLAQPQQVDQGVHQDVVLFEDGRALDVATVDVASDAAEDDAVVADEDADVVSPPPPRCVTQYIRFPVRGAVRVAPHDGGDMMDGKCGVGDEVVGVVAMDMSLGTPAVILGVVPADGKGAKSTTLSQALAHMKPYRKHHTIHLTKPTSTMCSTTTTSTATAVSTLLGQAIQAQALQAQALQAKSIHAPPLVLTKAAQAAVNKPTTRSATGSLVLPEDKTARAAATPIGTGRHQVERPWTFLSTPSLGLG